MLVAYGILMDGKAAAVDQEITAFVAQGLFAFVPWQVTCVDVF